MNYSDNISVRIRPAKVIKYMFVKDGTTSIVSITSAGLFVTAVIKFIRFLCDNTTAAAEEVWSFCLTGGLTAALFSITYFLEKCRLEEAAEEKLKEKRKQAEKTKNAKSTSKTYIEGQKQKRKIS